QIIPYSYNYWSDATYKLTVNFTADENWEQENNDAYSSYTNMPLNSPVYGSIKNDSDSDWYRFEVTEPGYISIDFDRPNQDSTDSLWEMLLCECQSGTKTPDTSYPMLHYYYKGNYESTKSCYIGLKPGIYYMQVATYTHRDKSTWSDATYKLTVNFTAADNWEQESNNDSKSYNNIPLNSPVYGSTKDSSDSDWYRFEVTEEDTFTISFDHNAWDNNNSFWRIDLYECTEGTTTPKSSSLNIFYCKGSAEKFTSESIKLTPGKYFIKVSPYSSSSYADWTYALTVKADSYVPPEETILYGDANCDDTVDISDAVLIMQNQANPEKYPISEKGLRNADCVDNPKGVTPIDALAIQMIEAKSIAPDALPTTAEYISSMQS
ncbi:MAG: hypothetical protein IKQ90_08170, partial [Ruminococcus sp.]|nr:hypothetical protein [Ruminococcus sp.]